MNTYLVCRWAVVEGLTLAVVDGLTVVVDEMAFVVVVVVDNDVAIFDAGQEMMKTLRGSFFDFSASISSFLVKKFISSFLY